MLGLVTLLLFIIVGGTIALVSVLRRARAEVWPTIDAFAEFRGALDPAVLSLRRDSFETARRLEQGRSSRRINSPSLGR
jgi:hypothetical protein